jgi:hypothetical protein
MQIEMTLKIYTTPLDWGIIFLSIPEAHLHSLVDNCIQVHSHALSTIWTRRLVVLTRQENPRKETILRLNKERATCPKDMPYPTKQSNAEKSLDRAYCDL